MNLHEFQAKELLTRYGIPIPRGRLAATAEEAEKLARRLDCRNYMVKAQVHAGRRAARGGVRLAGNAAEAGRIAGELIGRPLAASDGSIDGERVRWVYVEEALAFERSLYCAVLVDTASAADLLLLASPGGGSGAGQGAWAGSVIRRRITLAPDGPSGPFEKVARAMGLEAQHGPQLSRRLAQIAEAAVGLDATLIEINPLVLTTEGELVALDARMIIDDNALFRHPDLAALQEASESEGGDPLELDAQRHHLNYMRLRGDIGTIVNGAGLALATIDTLAEAGGRPANFMDIRTTATSLDVAYGFELIAGNPEVRAILVNVHGGGMQRCDTIADGIGIAMRRTGCTLPLIVRLAGNNAVFAAMRLKSYGLAFTEAADMWEAAQEAVRLASARVV